MAGNPTLNQNNLDRFAADNNGVAMTVEGAANKALILFGIMLASSMGSWIIAASSKGLAIPMMFAGLIVGFILSLVMIFKPPTAPVLAPVYAVCEGLLLGVISMVFNDKYSGIVFNAALITLSLLGGLLFLYRTGIVKVTEKFRAIVFGATAAIALTYLISILMRVFFKSPMPLIHDSGPIGIGFSLLAIVIAGMNFLVDFDNFEQLANAKAPKYMEWYCGYAILVTLVWMYLEVLRLLAKLQRN
ncbi:MAG: Bax inhibitor-1/YccA family protein [Armatimonadetes bacterium]|nr:Bax inhibitor-1/YccA family protein [Armatimonadota bacterium]